MRSWKEISNWEAAEHSRGLDSPLDVERRLMSLEYAYDAGNVLALFEASDICHEHNIQLPGWIAGAALDLIASTLLKLSSTSKRGRAAPPLARLREDLKRHIRWETVGSLIKHREGDWKEFQQLLQSPTIRPETRKKLLAQAPFNPGKNLEETFAAASRALVGTIAFGSRDTIRSSYKRVKKELKESKTASTFSLLSNRTYQKFGLDPMAMINPKPRRKVRVKK